MTSNKLRHENVMMTSDDDEVFLKEALEMAPRLRTDWEGTKLEHQFFTEGITNKLLSIWSEETGKSDRILFRIYGFGTELILDREMEVEVIQQLHSNGCAPPLYCTFQNGLAYGFFPGVTLDTTTVQDPRIGGLVAKSLVRLHSTPLTDAQRSAGAGVFKQIQKFLDQMPESFEDPIRNERYKKEFPVSEQLRHEMVWMRTETELLESPLVLCHNDLLIKNVLYNKKDDSVYLIDYEYACQNFQAFDIADHFIEYAGIDDPDFSIYPDREQQVAWLGHYLKHWHEVKSLPEPTELDLERLYVQVNRHAPISHFYWAIWAVVQAAISKIDYDYFEYGCQRMKWYFKLKERFSKLKLPENK